jgi:hypothetical protein
MIARHQTILFIVLVAASAIMGGVLWRQLDRSHRSLLTGSDSTPTQAPQVAPTETATLLVANDALNSLSTQEQSLPLPQDPGARARLVLGKLLDQYAAPDAAHPVPGGASGIAQVFLLPDPGEPDWKADDSKTSSLGLEMAVVNLTGGWVGTHPSGLETETLTVLSMCGTLHANLPRVTRVRFLVDGQPRATLAGHADLSRTYLTGDAAPTEEAHP